MLRAYSIVGRLASNISAQIMFVFMGFRNEFGFRLFADALSEIHTFGFQQKVWVSHICRRLKRNTHFWVSYQRLGFCYCCVFATPLKQNAIVWVSVPLGNYNILRGKPKTQTKEAKRKLASAGSNTVLGPIGLTGDTIRCGISIHIYTCRFWSNFYHT